MKERPSISLTMLVLLAALAPDQVLLASDQPEGPPRCPHCRRPMLPTGDIARPFVCDLFGSPCRVEGP